MFYNFLIGRHVVKTAHTTQASNKDNSSHNSPNHSFFKDCINLHKTTGDLGSLMLSSPKSNSKKKLMKVCKGLASPLGNANPSIPYKKAKKEGSLSPAKYDPKYDLLLKKSPTALMKPHQISTPHNSSSLNKYIEVFIHDVVDTTSKDPHSVSKILETMNKSKQNKSKSGSNSALNDSIIHTMSHHMNHFTDSHIRVKDRDPEDSFYFEANEYNSIAFNTAPIDSNIKMRSPFVSQTQRYPDIKPSPGPGSYNVTTDGNVSNQSDMKVSPQAFGSTYKRRTHFLNCERTPFGEPTYMTTPGVGYYNNTKKIPKRIQEEILKAQREREVQEGLQPKSGYFGSAERPCLSKLPADEIGPGKYNLVNNTTKSEPASGSIPKFKNKDAKSVFISTSPRFKDMMTPPGFNTTKSNQVEKPFESVKSQKQSPASRKFTRIKKLKQENFESNLKKEKSKQSFMFQSGSKRFITPRPARLENLDPQDIKEVSNHAALFGQHQKNLILGEPEKRQNVLLLTSYAATIGKTVPFNNHAPRFVDHSAEKYNSSTPGPGSYGEGKIRTEHDLKLAL